MALKETMKYFLDLDTSGFAKGLKDAGDEAKGTFDDIEDEGEESSGKFGGIGGKMGKALVAGFAAIGAGALMAKGINQAMDVRAGLKRLTGQFALTGEEAERYGAIAGDLYADGWGEGIQEVQQVVGLAAAKFGDATTAELGKIGAAVLAVSQTWGEDFESVIRSTDQLVQNGLAPNAMAALDLIVTGFQNGANEADDLLDTIDEYAQHWSAMGLSGEDALQQIIHGFQSGQRDGDKMADAVKEMRIRVIEDSDKIDAAYESLGLSADQLRGKFVAGGDSAREAFQIVIGALQSVEDPIERNRLVVELIGTQFEDLGPTALASLAAIEGGLNDVDGAAAALSTTVEATEWDKFSRSMTKGFGDLAEASAGFANNMFTEIARDMDGGAVGVMIDYADAMDAGRIAADAFDISLLDNVGSFAEARAKALEYTDQMGLTEDAAMDAANVIALEWNSALEESEAAEEAAERAAILHTEAMRDEARSADHVATTLGRVTVETDEVAEAAKMAAREVENLKDKYRRLLGELDNADAYDNVQTSLDGIVEAQERAAETAEEGGRRHEAAMRDVDAATRDAKREVIEYADEVGGIPEAAVTEILALIDEGKFDEADARLAELEADRLVTVRVQVHAQAAIDKLRNLKLPGFATGTKNAPGGAAIVGEQGPELVELPKGSRVHTAAATRRMTGSVTGGSAGGGNTYVIQVDSPLGITESQVRRIGDVIDEVERRKQGAL